MVLQIQMEHEDETTIANPIVVSSNEESNMLNFQNLNFVSFIYLSYFDPNGYWSKFTSWMRQDGDYESEWGSSLGKFGQQSCSLFM